MKNDLNIKLLSRVVGLVMSIMAIGMLPSMLVCILYGETEMLINFAAAFLLSLAIGLALQSIKPDTVTIRAKEAFLIATLCWVFASLVGAIPFFLADIPCGVLDAIFESTSGFTAVGASILPDMALLPKGLIFWRSSTVWLGGMGILIFAIAVLPALGIASYQIIKAENPGPNMEKLTAKTSDTAKILYLLYLSMTAIEVVLLTLGDMSVFDAFIHSFGTTGTGGFSSHNNSIAYFHSTYINVIIMIFMFMGSLNFNWYYDMLRGRWQALRGYSELKFYLCVLALFSAAISLILFLSGTYTTLGKALEFGVFQVISTASTTGYFLSDFTSWPLPAKILLFLLFFMGGCTASTSGSLRALRILTVLKYIKRELYLKVHPRAVVPVRLNGRPVSQESLSGVLHLIATYLCVFTIGCFLVSAFDGHGLVTSISAVAGVLSAVGVGFDEIGPAFSYRFFSAPSKVIFIVLMLLARLELFAVLILFTPSFWSTSRHMIYTRRN